MDIWDMNPEVMGSRWLMASATLMEGELLWLKASMIAEGQPCSFGITAWYLPYT
jgi:hypothetical protein